MSAARDGQIEGEKFMMQGVEVYQVVLGPGAPNTTTDSRSSVFLRADRVVDHPVPFEPEPGVDELRDQNERLLSAEARALERVQVDDSGEATMILEAVVELDGAYVERREDRDG